MPNVLKIPLEPQKHIYYLVDSNFFANKYLEPAHGDNAQDSDRIANSLSWWEVIEYQLESKHATVIIPDLCISETFKIIAKKYYKERKFASAKYQSIRNKITIDLSLDVKKLIAKNRHIKYHNLQSDRDIIVGVSRFLEVASKNNLHSISVIDLVLLSSAKYLIDFLKFEKDSIKIISGDVKILKCSRRVDDIPTVIDALNPKNSPLKYFN